MMRTMQAHGFALALVVGVVGALAAGARAQEGATPAKSVDLTGDWRLDPAHSDAPFAGGGGGGGGGEHGGHGGGGGYGGHHGGGGGGGGYGGGGGGGGWGGHHGGGGGGGGGDAANTTGSGGGGGARSPRLPDIFHITQTPALVSFEDSSGTVLQEIATVPAAADTMMRAPGALHITGAWDGTVLTVTHEGPRGKVKETWKLEANGKALDQVVAFESEQGSRTMKRVFRRVEED
jgi:hypothetical protein